MKTHAIAVVLATSAAAAVVGSTAPAGAAVAAHPHPPITDVAGDATTSLGVAVPSADVRSADLRIKGGQLVVTLKTTATAPKGSGPISNFDHAPYMIMGVFSDPNGQAVPFRITLNPGGRGVLAISDELSYEGPTTSADGASRVSSSLAEINPVAYLSQGVTARTTIAGAAAFAEVRSLTGTARDRTDNVTFVLGG